MDTHFFVVAVHAGLMAAGFAIAGVSQFQKVEKDNRLSNAAVIDPTGIAVAIAANASVIDNWECVQTGRRLIYASLVSMIVTFVALLGNW